MVLLQFKNLSASPVYLNARGCKVGPACLIEEIRLFPPFLGANINFGGRCVVSKFTSWAIVLVLGFVVTLSGEEPHTVRDLTPPEFLQAVEPVPETPAGEVFAAAEFLLFTPRQRGLDFVLEDGRDDLTPVGRVRSLNYKTEPGIRASLGYRPGGYPWDVRFTYTYITSSDNFGVVANPAGVLYPTLTRTGMTNEVNVAFASSSLSINVYDAEFGYHFEQDFFHARIFGGLRLANVREMLTADYDGRDAQRATVDVRPNFDGVGPLFGIESTIGMGQGLGVFGRASVALLTGSMRAPFVETNNVGGTVYADVADRFALTVPVVTLGVGVSYQYRGLSIRAGYEVSNWFGVFERPAFTDDFAEGKFLRQSSSLGIDGVFVQLGLEF